MAGRGAEAPGHPIAADPGAAGPNTPTWLPQAEPARARPRPGAAGPDDGERQEPAGDRRPAPDRPVEVHIGTIEITAPAPPPARRARGPVGFAGYERLRSYAWDD